MERQHQLRVSQYSHCSLPRDAKEELKFRLLREKDLSPVNYKRVAEKDGKEVPWDEIVKGYEYEKGKYVVLKDEDFQRVDLEATQTVDIQDFVDQEEIDPIYLLQTLLPGATKRRGQSLCLAARDAGEDRQGRDRQSCDQNAAISRRGESER